MSAFELETLVRVRGRWVPLWIALAVAAVSAAAYAIATFSPAQAGELAGLVMVVSAYGAFALVTDATVRTPRRARVEVTPDAIRVAGRSFARNLVSDVYAEMAGSGGVVHVVGRRGRRLFTLVAPDIATACALVDALAPSDEGGRMRVTAPRFAPAVKRRLALSALFASPLAALTFPLMGAGAALPIVMAGVLVAAAVALRVLTRRTSVVVAPDAVEVEREPSLAIDTVSCARHAENALRLHAPGRAIDVDFGRAMDLVGGELVRRADRVAQAVDSRRTAYEAAAPVRAAAERLARGERAKDVWASDVVGLAADGPYRGAALRDEELWSVLADASLPAEPRAAAAYLLRRRAPDADAVRVRVAVETSVSVRVALTEIEEAAGVDEGARPNRMRASA